MVGDVIWSKEVDISSDNYQMVFITIVLQKTPDDDIWIRKRYNKPNNSNVSSSIESAIHFWISQKNLKSWSCELEDVKYERSLDPVCKTLVLINLF